MGSNSSKKAPVRTQKKVLNKKVEPNSLDGKLQGKASNDSVDNISSLGASGELKQKTKSKKIHNEFSKKHLEDFFNKYAENSEMIDADGIQQLCNDLVVLPEDVRMMVFAWHLDASEMGSFTRAEFIDGLTKLECDNITKLKAKLEVFTSELKDPKTFKSIYEFSFRFAKEPEQRSIDIDTALALNELLLGNEGFAPKFRDYLKNQIVYKVVNKDQWRSFLEFNCTIDQDLNNYDADSCWPVMLDEFVQYLQANTTTSSNRKSQSIGNGNKDVDGDDDDDDDPFDTA